MPTKPKSKSSRSGPRHRSRPPATEAHAQVIELNLNRDLLVLQVPTSVGYDLLVNLFLDASAAWAQTLEPGDEWFCFAGNNQQHYAGRNLWVAMTDNARPEMIEILQAGMERNGNDSSVEMGLAANLDLVPLFRVTASGCEWLIPAALVGAPGRTVTRARMTLPVRGYTVFKGTYSSGD